MGSVGQRLFAVTLCVERASVFFRDNLCLMTIPQNNALGATNAKMYASSAVVAGLTSPRDLLA